LTLNITTNAVGKDHDKGHDRLDASASEAGRAGLVVLALRVAGAGLAYVTQVLMARLMGVSEYGLFATAWVWIAILGHAALFGLSQTTCRFVPAYITRGEYGLARGFLARGWLFVAIGSVLIASIWVSCVWVLRGWLEGAAVPVMMLAAVVVPIFALQDYAESVARAFNRPILAIAPPYVVRQSFVAGGMILAVWIGFKADASLAIAVTLVATLCVLAIQVVLLRRVVKLALPIGERVYRMRAWAIASIPVAFVDLATLLIGYADVLLLSLFAPPEAVAIYFAATRLVQFINFIGYAASAATSARLTSAHARGDHAELAHLVKRTTQWSTLAAALVAISIMIAAPLLLRLFGVGFESAVPLVAIMAVGLVIQVAMGPGESVLNMLGQERACALGSSAALAIAIGFSCFLTPVYGPVGAAIAMASANMVRGAMLAFLSWRRLGVWTPLSFGQTQISDEATTFAPVQVLSGDEIDAMSGDAALLARDALEPNPYYAPRILNAQRQNLQDMQALHVLAVRDDNGLIGWLPYRPDGGWLGLGRVAAAWSGDYSMSSTPLLARRAADASAQGLAHGLISAVGRRSFLLPRLPIGTAAAQLIMDAFTQQGCRIRMVAEVDRAVLARHGSHASYVAEHVSSSRRKSLRNRRNRLSRMGQVVTRSVTQADELKTAVDVFLRLEKSGWKGRRGTAFASHFHTQAMALAMFTPDGCEPAVRADVLEIDGRAIAVSLAFVSGGRAHMVKTAYDERYRSYGPGLLLDNEIMKAFLDGNELMELDSASTPGCVLEDLWIDRVRIADVLVITDKNLSEAAIDRIIKREHMRRAAVISFKIWAHKLQKLRGAVMARRVRSDPASL
jgi:O-antigen/teichoic acid export membrane protein